MAAHIKVIIMVTMTTAVALRDSPGGETRSSTPESAESLQQNREVRSAHTLHLPLHSDYNTRRSHPSQYQTEVFPWQHSGHGFGDGYHRGNNKKGFHKALKSGFAKGVGYRGKKGFRDKEGYKKRAKGNHGKWRHKGYHDKDGKRYKGRKHLEKYYGDVHKGHKGKKGHNLKTKGHHNKGHKDKGFKNVYHKEEYHYKRKFYDDFDNKKYHDKYDDTDKYRKGKKGSDFKGGFYKGGYHNDKYGAKDEKEKGKYHDNDYKVKDNYKHHKYYKDKHKHGAHKGFKGGYGEGHSGGHGYGHDPSYRVHEDHHGHHSNGQEQFEEPPEPPSADAGHEELVRWREESEGEGEENQKLSPSQRNPIQVQGDEIGREKEETRNSYSNSSRHFRPRPSYRAFPISQSNRNSPQEWNESNVTKPIFTKQNFHYQHAKPTMKTGRRSHNFSSSRLWRGKSKSAPIVSPNIHSLKLPPNHRSQREMTTTYIPPTVAPRKVRKKPKVGVSYSYGRRIASSHIPTYVSSISGYNPESSLLKHSPPYSALETKLVPRTTKWPKFRHHKSPVTNSLKTQFSSQSIAESVANIQNHNPGLKSKSKFPKILLPLPNQDSTIKDKSSNYQQVKNPISRVRQSLRYKVAPKVFSLHKPTFDTYQPSSLQNNNSSNFSLPNKLANKSLIGLKYFVSYPDFESFGKFGVPEEISILPG